MSGTSSKMLASQFVEKPWGSTELPAIFGDTRGRRIGEVWFTGSSELPLLAKYIFTSEALSIQNHPSDEQARSRGLPRGKEECWFVLDAEPGATLGLGPKRPVQREELREAALDGSIVDLIDWKPVSGGDFYFVPAGTVHAIGAGVSLIEFQQNSDVTYRMYDYGRPRELRLDDAVAVADTEPFADPRSRPVDPTHSSILVAGPPFSLDHVIANDSNKRPRHRRRWVLPIEGEARCGDLRAHPGECMLVEPGAEVSVTSGRALFGAESELD
ncbi:class I mannose-6-phosphate isomerase [Sphingomonas sp. URHD0057]|uniref:class I mannose-6-phosphate isomerase n=1 Tax=Sphingomonas sp. URHD0057 TaxID=1380389 RepID=UPI00056CB5BD|nr:class I mannose-6-phosphate isomerase [Sphingomonas sp. URHD0057]